MNRDFTSLAIKGLTALVGHFCFKCHFVFQPSFIDKLVPNQALTALKLMLAGEEINVTHILFV